MAFKIDAQAHDIIAAVYQTVGAASSPSMWDKDGVFEDQIAVEIANTLLDFIREYVRLE